MRMQRGHARWNGQVKLVEVHIVTAPGEGLTASGEHHARNAIDGTCGLMLAGNPFGSDNSERASGNRQIDLGVKKSARGVCEVGGDLNRRLLTLRRGACGKKDDRDC